MRERFLPGEWKGLSREQKRFFQLFFVFCTFFSIGVIVMFDGSTSPNVPVPISRLPYIQVMLYSIVD